MGNLCSSFDTEEELMELRHDFATTRLKELDHMRRLEKHIAELGNALDASIKRIEKLEEKHADLHMRTKIVESKAQNNYSFINNKSAEINSEMNKIRQESIIASAGMLGKR